MKTAAFLADNHKGMEPRRHNRSHHWRPRHRVNALGRALRALPRLTADIGFAIASHRGARVEVLPGTPTTIAFSLKGQLCSMIVVPFSPDEARKRLGLPPTKRRSFSAEALFEEQRVVTPPDELLIEAQYDAWGL